MNLKWTNWKYLLSVFPNYYAFLNGLSYITIHPMLQDTYDCTHTLLLESLLCRIPISVRNEETFIRNHRPMFPSSVFESRALRNIF